MLNQEEYRFILRNDLTSFIERGFYELNPQTRFLSTGAGLKRGKG